MATSARAIRRGLWLAYQDERGERHYAFCLGLQMPWRHAEGGPFVKVLVGQGEERVFRLAEVAIATPDRPRKGKDDDRRGN